MCRQRRGQGAVSGFAIHAGSNLIPIFASRVCATLFVSGGLERNIVLVGSQEDFHASERLQGLSHPRLRGEVCLYCCDPRSVGAVNFSYDLEAKKTYDGANRL